MLEFNSVMALISRNDRVLLLFQKLDNSEGNVNQRAFFFFFFLAEFHSVANFLVQLCCSGFSCEALPVHLWSTLSLTLHILSQCSEKIHYTRGSN